MTFSLLPQPLTLHPDPQGPDGQTQLGKGQDAVLILVIKQEQLSHEGSGGVGSYNNSELLDPLAPLSFGFPHFLLTKSMFTISSPPVPFTFFTHFRH